MTPCVCGAELDVIVLFAMGDGLLIGLLCAFTASTRRSK